MNIKQKLLGLGLAALLNGSCKDNGDFDYEGEIVDITYYRNRNGDNRIDASLYNHNTGRAFAEFGRNGLGFPSHRIEIPDYLQYRFNVGSTLKLKNCKSEIEFDYQEEPAEKVYILSYCELK